MIAQRVNSSLAAAAQKEKLVRTVGELKESIQTDKDNNDTKFNSKMQ